MTGVVRVLGRTVAKPWEPEVSVRTVKQEAHVRPDPSALARYQRVFPHRRVEWNVRRQCFEVLEQMPGWSFPQRVSLVVGYATDPEQGGLVYVFQPFDHEWVSARLEEYALICREGRSAVGRRVAEHNRKVQADRIRESHVRMKEWMQDDRRWLPVLAAVHAGERPDVALAEKVPLVSPGVTLTS